MNVTPSLLPCGIFNHALRIRARHFPLLSLSSPSDCSHPWSPQLIESRWELIKSACPTLDSSPTHPMITLYNTPILALGGERTNALLVATVDHSGGSKPLSFTLTHICPGSAHTFTIRALGLPEHGTPKMNWALMLFSVHLPPRKLEDSLEYE